MFFDYALAILATSAVNWVVLLIVIPIAQKLGDFGLPPWGELLWKMAVVSVASNAASVLLGFVNPFLGWAASLAVLWYLLYLFLELDLFGAIMIIIVNMIFQYFLAALLLSMLIM